MKYPIIFLLCTILVFSSCEDFLSTIPDNASTIDLQLVDAEDAREYLNGAYDAATRGSVLGGQFALISELMSDGIDGQGLGGDWFAHYSRSTDIFLGTTRSMMSDGFKMAGRANNVLDQLESIEGLSDLDKQIFEGETKFLRSLIHFDAVRFFGQPYGFTADNSQLGVVIRTSQNAEVLNRSTVGEVYTQIINDLTDAINLLPASNDIYANQWAAKALLAKVYFQMNDFENAFSFANDVIENSPYEFDTEYSSKYGYGESTEIIFGLISTQLDNDNANGGLRGYFRPDPSTGVPALFASAEYATAFATEPNDTRKTSWLMDVSGRNAVTKFNIEGVYTNPVIHLTEMKLIRGESAAENSSNEIGVGDLNDIRERAGMLALSANLAGTPLIQQLRIERHKELYFENNRMHELKRQALRDNPNLTIRNAPWDCAGMVCQLPDNELKGNPDMEPNPQGGCN